MAQFGRCVADAGGTGAGRRRTPCTILTGFLGAGKTTLVNHILRSRDHGVRVAVIENEFGEVGVDDALVIETEEEVFEMNNGCVCCTVRGDLIRILSRLSRRDDLDHVLIETTGLADPAPVAQTFFVDDDVKEHYELDAIVTVVDARHVLRHLDEKKPEGVENESVEQVAFADRILLNKIDLVTDDEKAEVRERLRGINQFAEVMETRYSKVDVASVLGVRAFDLSRVLQKEEDFLDEAQQHRHDDTVTSVGIELDGALDLIRLNSWLTVLLRDRGVDLFRFKGVLNVSGSDARHVFQGVHMLMTIGGSDDEVGRPWGEGEERGSRLVFIGRNLDGEALREGFRACLV